jgi:hypothetical protein
MAIHPPVLTNRTGGYPTLLELAEQRLETRSAHKRSGPDSVTIEFPLQLTHPLMKQGNRFLHVTQPLHQMLTFTGAHVTLLCSYTPFHTSQ